MAFLDLILLAALAAFLGYRLWLVLGTHEKDKPIRKRRSAEDDNVVPVRPQSFSEKTAKKPETQSASKDINEDRFLQGAEAAFRKIVQAYALGEVAVLQKLLEGPLLETFEEAIEKRKKAKTALEVEISRIVTSEILTQREEKGTGYVTVRFVSEQCLVTRDSKGKVLEGDPDRFTEVTDIWTFARPLESSDPNWKLVATQVPEA